MPEVRQIVDSSFNEEVLKSEIPVLVDFWAPWCGPCRMITPILDEIAQSYDGKLKVCKLNTDENQNTYDKYAIRSIPTLILFKNGEKVETVVGAIPKTTLTNLIDKYIN